MSAFDPDTLIDHAIWANTALAEHLRGIGWPAAPARLISHIVLAEAVWLARLDARTPTDTDIFRTLEPDEVLRRAREQLPDYRAHLSADANRVVRFRRLSGEEGSCTVAEIALQVLTHGFHHRGQIASWCSANGTPAPRSDLIVWLWQKR